MRQLAVWIDQEHIFAYSRFAWALLTKPSRMSLHGSEEDETVQNKQNMQSEQPSGYIYHFNPVL